MWSCSCLIASSAAHDLNGSRTSPALVLGSEDEDEDKGQPLPRAEPERTPSPDPIDVLGSLDLHTAVSHTDSASVRRSTRVLPRDGPSTTGLRKRVQARTFVKPKPFEGSGKDNPIALDSEPEADDEIQSYSSSEEKPKSPPPKEVVKDATNYASKKTSKSVVVDAPISPGHVSHLKDRFESHSTEIVDQRKASPHKKQVRTIDLSKERPHNAGRNVLTSPGPKPLPGVKSRMKAKSAANVCHTLFCAVNEDFADAL